MLMNDINQLQDLSNLLAMHLSQRNTSSSPYSPNLPHTLNLDQVEQHVGYCPSLFPSDPSFDPQVQEKNTSYHQVKKYYSLECVLATLKKVNDTEALEQKKRGVDKSLTARMHDPSYLDGVANTFKKFECTLNKSKTSASAWVSEAGKAYNSG
ncbi:retrotransposon protein, putative, unclassified [Tanacetum coccineum]